ncbi:hypothetical protein [Clostridium formicaceticum]|uniref:Uncharacterized protein n=1 Tax=Clostridium formicaceticum TaxID=1497 RepID=A0AAC9RPY8_9CLOT|nr:hypothetical protein [Clostridium formicaceticum]AOY74732.1 hypothetical protein BJL90_01440 [Clostridium formicaceticum]ARE89118.1 hypothetical protein CLFO_35240 [Clostridium formicaceticum]
MGKSQIKKNSNSKQQPAMSQDEMLAIISSLAKQIELLNGTVDKLTVELANNRETALQVNKINLFMQVAKVKIQDTLNLLKNEHNFSTKKFIYEFRENINMIKSALSEVKNAILEIPHTISEKVNGLKNQAKQKVNKAICGVDNAITYAKEVAAIQMTTPEFIVNQLQNALQDAKKQHHAAMKMARSNLYGERKENSALNQMRGLGTVSERQGDEPQKSSELEK